MFCSPFVLCLLNCVTETIQGLVYIPRGPHVGQPCFKSRVSNRQVACGHICKLCVYCKKYTV